MLRTKYHFYWAKAGEENVRPREVPAPLVWIGLALLAALVLGGAPLAVHYVYEYRALAGKGREAAALRELSQDQRIELQRFASRITTLEDEMARVRSFNTKLKVLANLQFTEQRETEFLQGVGGPAADQASVMQLLDRTIEEQTRRMRLQLEDLHLEARIQREAIAELKDFLATKSSLLASTPSIRPVLGWISSHYGPRPSSFSARWEFHRGLDIAARTGTPVAAPADGIVVMAERYGGYGNLVVLDHGYDTETRFGHLSRFRVKPGDRVKRGDVIAEVGSTGRSTGPHLHYEVRLAGKAVDPSRYILD